MVLDVCNDQGVSEMYCSKTLYFGKYIAGLMA